MLRHGVHHFHALSNAVGKLDTVDIEIPGGNGP